MVRARRRRRPLHVPPPVSEAPSAPRAPRAPRGLLLALAVAALWSLGARGGWIYDDFPLLVNRPPPQGLDDVLASLSQAHWNQLPYYRPLSRALLTAERLLLGADPTALRLVNAALMGAVAWTAFALLRAPTLRVPRDAALACAALVALHPCAAEAVFIASAGPESIAYLPCVLGAVAAWMHPGALARGLALALMAAGLLFKEQAVVTPALFALADALGLSADAPGRSARRWLARYAPVLALVAAWLALRGAMISAPQGPRLALLRAPSRVPLSFVYTAQTLLAPSPTFAYEPEFTLAHGPARTLLALALAGAFARRASKVADRRVLGMGLGWAALAVLPTANIAAQETHFAERYVLLAAPGVALALASAWSSRWRGAAALALAAMCAVTLARRQSFRDNETFLRQWEATDPRPYRALGALGEEAMRRGRVAEAIALYRRGIAIDPVRARYLHRPLAVAHEELGQVDDAVAEYRRAVRANRRDEAARAALARLTSSRGP